MKDVKNKVAGIFFTNGSSVLLLRRSDLRYRGQWDLPGGHAKVGESPIDNAIRETKEELGINKIPGIKIGNIKNIQQGKQYNLFFYKIENKFNIKLNNEHDDYEWVKFNKISKKRLIPKLKNSIKEYVDFIKNKEKHIKEWNYILQIFERKLWEHRL
jgi:8-oxo-dGTP pyrophosphatase MutT (NUDIX family)